MAAIPTRPVPLPVNFDGIPGELRYLNQWVLWRYVWKDDAEKWDKPPYQPNGKLASSIAALTWSTFQAVKDVYEHGLNLPVDDPSHFDGVGFVPRKIEKAELQIVLGDLDKCRDRDTGEISAEALKDLKLVNSYCEPSPSGTGLRFVARGASPFSQDKDGRKKGNIELYQGGHYLTITGQRLPEFPATIERRVDELNAFYAKHFSKSESETEPQRARDEKVDPLSSDAVERLQELFQADPAFKEALFIPAPVGERSTQECYLCARLWAAGFNEEEIYSIMSSSPLNKWIERDDGYRWSTIRAGTAKAEETHEKRVAKEAAKKLAKKAEPIKLKDVADIEYDDKGNMKKVRFSPTFAANAVLDRMSLAMSEDSEDIYRFTGQIYKSDGTRKIDLALSHAADDLFTGDKLKETLRRIKKELLENPVIFDPDPYLLGVKNGVINLLTGEIREYRDEDLILDQIPVSYDPSARCPAFLAFLESITPNISDRITLIDWVVANAIKQSFAYVLFLLGLGRNGKGIYERLLKKFFGQSAFRDMILAEVTKNNFAASAFYRKRGWIASESGQKKAVIGTDFIKLTTGNGVIDFDRKNISRIVFEPYFQTIVDTNNMPKIEDNSRGWIERFVKIDLPYVFVPNPNETNPLEKREDPGLFEKLTTSNELSGILNLLLFRSKTIGKSRTIHKRSGAEMFAEYAEQSTSVATFLDLFCEYASDLSSLKTPFGPIYDANKEWCGYKVGEVVDGAYFGRQLKRFCGGRDRIVTKDKDRKTVTAYPGLIFDDKKHRAAIDALKKSMSPVCLQISTEESTEESNQCLAMSTVSTVKLWNKIIEKFDKLPKEKISSKGEIGQNTVDTVDTVDISIQRACGKAVDCRQIEDISVDTGINAELQAGKRRVAEKEEHFKTPISLKTKIIPLRFLVDFSVYKKDDVIGIPSQGDLSTRPGICELITCGQCPTAIQGAKPFCDPCNYKGRAEA